jgi:hypothetical protein
MRAPLRPCRENSWSAAFRILARVPSSSSLAGAVFDLLDLVIEQF